MDPPNPHGAHPQQPYVRLEQLTAVSAAEILRLHGMGPKAVEQLRRADHSRLVAVGT